MPLSKEYLIRRIILQVAVVLGVIIITFIITRVIPARPEFLWAGSHPTPEQLQKARESLHLDKNILVQLYLYFIDLFKGNWGISWRTRSPILDDLSHALPATLELIIVAFIFAIIVGVPIGILAAVRRGGITDNVVRVLTVLGASMPTFWLALIVQLVFGTWLRWFPAAGRVADLLVIQTGFHPITGFYLIDSLLEGKVSIFLDVLRHMILPAIVLSLYPMSLSARMTRALMVEVLSEQYIRSAIVWGIPGKIAVYKYALKNAISPVIASLGLSFGYTIVGAFLIELIFVWPGVGLYLAMSLLSFDYPAVIGVVIIIAIFYTTINMIVDIAHAYIDPRVKL
ncbi:MAG: ABC transporter permease [Thermoprotei archaeon]